MTERTIYELWDNETGNAIVAFDTEGEAVTYLRRVVAEESHEYLNQLALIEVNRFGFAHDVARGGTELHEFQARGGTVRA